MRMRVLKACGESIESVSLRTKVSSETMSGVGRSGSGKVGAGGGKEREAEDSQRERVVRTWWTKECKYKAKP